MIDDIRNMSEPKISTFRRYSRGRNLREVEGCYSPFPSQLRQNLNDTLSFDLTTKSFVPFLRERDSTGKLLSTARDHSCRSRSPTFNFKPSSPRRPVPLKRFKLKRPVPEIGTPGVGTYLVDMQWVRRTYSTYKEPQSRPPTTPIPPELPKSEVRSTPALVPKFQYSVRPRKPDWGKVDKYYSLRPEVAMRKMEKTNFQSVKLKDDPETIMASFQFVEKRKLKDEKLKAARRFMRRMLKGKFYE